MDKDISIYLKQILDSIILIESYISGVTEQQFLDDKQLQDSVALRLHVIGELSNKLPDEFKDQVPEIPWVEIVGMRNFIAHQYLEVTQARVWQTIVADLPSLKETLLTKLKQAM